MQYYDCMSMPHSTKENTTSVFVRVSPELKKKIDDSAISMGISTSELIRRAIHVYINTEEFKQAYSEKVFELLENPEYIARLKEKLKE